MIILSFISALFFTGFIYLLYLEVADFRNFQYLHTDSKWDELEDLIVSSNADPKLFQAVLAFYGSREEKPSVFNFMGRTPYQRRLNTSALLCFIGWDTLYGSVLGIPFPIRIIISITVGGIVGIIINYTKYNHHMQLFIVRTLAYLTLIQLWSLSPTECMKIISYPSDKVSEVVRKRALRTVHKLKESAESHDPNK